MNKDYRLIKIGHLMIGEELKKDVICVEELRNTVEELLLEKISFIKRITELENDLNEYRTAEYKEYISGANSYMGERISTL